MNQCGPPRGNAMDTNDAIRIAEAIYVVGEELHALRQINEALLREVVRLVEKTTSIDISLTSIDLSLMEK